MRSSSNSRLLRLWQLLIFAGFLLAWYVGTSPTRASHSSPRRRASSAPTPRNSRPAVTFASALRHGISASDWNM